MKMKGVSKKDEKRQWLFRPQDVPQKNYNKTRLFKRNLTGTIRFYQDEITQTGHFAPPPPPPPPRKNKQQQQRNKQKQQQKQKHNNNKTNNNNKETKKKQTKLS